MTSRGAKALLCLIAFGVLEALSFGGVRSPQAPVFFEPNRGQFESSVQFVGRMADVPVGLFSDGVGFESSTTPGSAKTSLRMRFLGLNGKARWTGLLASPGVSNYLTSSSTVTNVERFQKARANGVYPGIDVEVHGAGSQVEYDFIVHSGADPSRIQYKVEGSVTLDKQGELVLRAGSFELRNRVPQLYQEMNGVRTPVNGHFVVRDHTISFAVGSYDKRQLLVIDPVVFGKTLSASGNSNARAVTTDSSGNFYVTGSTDSAFVPSTGKSFAGGSSDVLVMKLGPGGDPIWSTILGGSASDFGRAIMVDSTGAVIVVGDTGSTDFPMAGLSYQTTNKGKSEAFIVRLNSQGTAANYSSYFGGTDDEFVNTAVLDAAGNVLFGGYTFSTNLPTGGTPVLQPALNAREDFFVTKLSLPVGTTPGQLIFSTYFGGPGQDQLRRIALDTAGNIYLAGWSTSTTFTATAGAAQSANSGQNDNIIARLNPTATTVQMLTYLGGSLSDSPNGLAVEPDGSAIWVAGISNSTNFPTTVGAMQRVLGGGIDATLFKLDNKGALLASTYFGGPNDDSGDAVISQAGVPIFVGVLTTDQYNKTASDAGVSPRATTGNTMSFETMKPDLSDTTATTRFIPDNDLAYVANSNCQVNASDSGGVVCAGAGLASSQGIPRAEVVDFTTTQSSGSTPPIGFVPQIRAEKGLLAAPDPVDGATGAFYDTITDLDLGGSLSVQFKRYYASTLSTGGVLTSLGTNWMSNFDQRIEADSTTAKVLLFGGKIVNFTKSGSSWQLASPLDVQYQLSQGVSSYTFWDPTANLVYTFNSTGGETRVQDRNGNAINVTLGTDGPVSAVDNFGRKFTFTYTGGRLTKIQDQTSTRTVSFTYNGNALTSSTDVLGQTTNYSYTTAGALISLMTARQYPLGARVTQSYDSTGRVTSQTLPTNSKVTTISFDTQGGTKITDSSGAATSETFDSNGAATGFKDPSGASFAVTYDSVGRRTGWTDKNGGKVAITYDAASGRIASQKSAAGITTSYIYTAQTQGNFTFYLRTGINYGDGTSATYAYDSVGNLTSATDRTGAVTKYTYGAFGNPLTVTKPNNAVVTYTYNTDGTVATTTDALTNVITYGHDSLKRVNKVTEANGSVTNYTYDLAGNRLSVQQPVGSTNTTTLDADGRRSSFAYAGGGTFNFAYTKSGKVSSLTSPTGGKRSYAYDDSDRLLSISDATGVASSYTYDSTGRMTKTALGTGSSSATLFKYAYDAEGRVTGVTDGTNRTWSYNFDADGRPSGMIPPGGGAFGLKYDAAGRLIGQVNPLGGTVNFTLDGRARILSTSLAGNTITTSVKRDTLGRVTELTDPNGNKWPATYDVLGRITSTTDPLGQAWTLAYTKNRLTAATFPLGSVAITTDANGRITKRAFSDGTNINQSFDARGLIATADNFSVTRDATGLPTATNGIAVGLDAAGRAKSFTYAAGKTVTYSYDAQGRVSSIADWLGGTTTIDYDGAGRIVGMTYPNSVRTTQAWDLNGRVNRIISGNLGNITLTRNSLGQVTSAERNLPSTPTLAVGTIASTFDAANQMAGATYDKMGRATSQNGRSYTWNLASQLTGFTAGGQTTSLTYDGLAHLNTSTTSGVTRSYVYNHLAKLPALSIVKQGGSDLRYYVYLPDGRVLYSVEASGNARHFYHFDEMGNTTFLTDDAGKVSDTYAITPFGEVADRTGTTDNPFTWQGQLGIIQEAPGLFMMRSRQYDATTGRFLSRDLLTSGDPRSGTPYAYAENNPLQNIDPYGNATTDQIEFFSQVLNNPETTPEIRQGIYQVLEDKLTESFQRGKVNFYAYIVWSSILSIASDHSDLDLTALVQLAYPPDPPPPPDPPKPVVVPPPAPKRSAAPKTTGALLLPPAGPLGPLGGPLPGGLVGP
ncbi:MAG: SBBP repeat-containing protein, partial [Acidobacteriota bacterium]